jgi:hypothetical protein
MNLLELHGLTAALLEEAEEFRVDPKLIQVKMAYQPNYPLISTIIAGTVMSHKGNYTLYLRESGSNDYLPHHWGDLQEAGGIYEAIQKEE